MRRFAISFSAAVLCFLALGAASASAAAPTIPRTAVSEVTTHSATLEAEINPQGKAVSYHFEYGAADCASGPCTSTPSPKEGQIKAGNAAVLVTAPLEGLEPGASYHFRVIAHSTGVGGGEATSPDRLFATFALPQAFEPCPNDAFRNGQPSASLPDCRAYEQASPVDKNGGDLWSEPEQVAASIEGDAVTFLNDAGLPGAEGEQNFPTFLATRGAAGWSTQGVLPAVSAGEDAHVSGWLPDLSQFYVTATKQASPQVEALLARSSADGSLAMLAPYVPKATPYFAGAATDGSVVLFEVVARAAKPGEEEGKRTLYAWDRESGKATQVSVLNTQAETESALAKGAFAGPYNWFDDPTTKLRLEQGGARTRFYTADGPALAADGSAAYFTAAATGNLYVRLNPTAEQSALDGEGNCTEADKACTLQVNASRKTNGGAGGRDGAGPAPAAFQAASADGAKAFFTSSEKLTNDATTGPEPLPPAIARSGIGGEGKDLSFFPTHAHGLAIDGPYIYWSDPQSGRIGRATLSGAEAQEGFITGADNPHDLAIQGEYLYWANTSDGKDGTGSIGRAKLNGSGAASEVQQDFITGTSNTTGVAVDATHVYWGNRGSSAATTQIMRTDLGGEDPEAFGGLGEHEEPRRWPATHLAIDEADTKLYFVYHREDTLDSTSIEWISLSDQDSFGGFAPNGQAGRQGQYDGLTILGSHVYWSGEEEDAIDRANLDGSGVEFDFVKGAGHPRGIAADASHLYWAASQEVVPNAGNDLYRYEPHQPAAQRLVDLTPDPGEEAGADVRGVLGASADGSYLYFAANGVLAPGATPGDCRRGSVGIGTCNLYLAHGTEIEFVARMEAAANNWRPLNVSGFGSFTPREARVSADGQTLIFREDERLYRYYAPDQSTECISCSPTGEVSGAGRDLESPGPAKPGSPSAVLGRFSSADGRRVFFQTTGSLVAEDTNAIGGCPEITANGRIYATCQDVYEWEAKGSGSCESESLGGGCLYLISSGKDTAPSFLIGTSASGDDVFIFTRSQLVGQDQDGLRDVYDVRVGGGLSSQYPPPPNPCAGEACMEGVGPAPEGSSAGSEQLRGPGNGGPGRPRCHKPRVHRRGGCVKPAKRHKHRRETKGSGRAGR